MISFKLRGFALITILAISACATVPGTDSDSDQISGKPSSPAKPFKEKPGDISFENTTADIMYRMLIGEMAAQRGNADVASEFYVDAAKQSKDPRIASRAVRISNFADNKENALDAAKIWVGAEPENQEANRILAILYLRENNTEKAQEILTKLLDEDKEALSRNLLLTGAMLQRETSSESAEKVARHLQSLYPEMAEAHYIHASLAMQADFAEEALKSIEKCLKIRPDWVDAIVLYPRILQENAQVDKAVEYLQKYLKDNPKQDAIRLAYARALVDARKLEKARDQFELLAVKMPNNQDVLFALAMISMQFKEYDEAEGYLKQLDKLGKTNSQVIFYLGQIAEQKEEYDKAQNWYGKINEGEFYIDAQLRLSVIIAKTKTVKEARELLQSVNTKSDNEKRQVLLFEGNLLRDFKEYQASYDFFTKLLKEDEKDMEYLYFRSLVAERLNKIDIVIQDLSYVIENDPDNAAALNALGYTLADRTDKLKEALQLIQRARELEPNDPAIVDSLGWVNYKLGNNEAALKYLAEAMEKIEDGEVSAHYGEVLWVTGDKEKAIKIWKKAKENFGDNEVLLKTLERFGQN